MLFRRDDIFGKPKADCRFSMVSPPAYESPTAAVLSDLFAKIVKVCPCCRALCWCVDGCRVEDVFGWAANGCGGEGVRMLRVCVWIGMWVREEKRCSATGRRGSWSRVESRVERVW